MGLRNILQPPARKKKYFEELEGEGKLHEVFQFLKDFADHCEAFPGQKMDKQAKMESITESDEQE